jgi:DNA-binding NarL/FixJ family response regulator
METGVKIYLLSSCKLRRAGLERICENEAEFDLVGIENAIPNDMEVLSAANPDIFVVDQSLFGNGYAQDTNAMLHRFHEISHIIILADQLDPSFACSAIAGGVEGYLLTSSPIEEMLQALRVVAMGGMWLEHNVIQVLAEQVVHANSLAAENGHLSRLLSAREQEILCSFAGGQTSKEIASQLYLSESSVRTYWYRVLNKLNAINKAEAIAIASHMGLLGAPQPVLFREMRTNLANSV